MGKMSFIYEFSISMNNWKIVLDFPADLWYYSTSVGALAQLGARHTGSVEVTGSNPVSSL